MKVKIEVQPQDFEGASYLNTLDCPNARAIKRVVKNIYPWVNVGGVNVHIFDNLQIHTIELPKEAFSIVRRLKIENGKFVWTDTSAFSYELEMPEHLIKSELTYNHFIQELERLVK